MACFSSQVERLISFIESAKHHNKIVALEGRSIKANLEIAKKLGLTDFGHVIDAKNIHEYPDHKIVCLLTGSQGEEFGALNRISRGDHRSIKFKPNDTIVLSASVIPGNHYQVAQMKNRLFDGSYNIITYHDTHVHSSGHANREELKWVNQQIPYKYFMPVHGEPYMVRMHAKMVHEELGLAKDKIMIPDDGTIVEFRKDGKEMIKLRQTLPNTTSVIDGTYQGELQKVVCSDRKTTW